MSAPRFEPTPVWTHALEEPDCPYHLLLVVQDACHVIGWCRTFPSICNAYRQRADLGIGLLPEYRNQGLGTTLVRQSLDWARMRGIQYVTLTTRPDNIRALGVFTRCGFTFTGQIRNGMVEMMKDLSSLYDVPKAHATHLGLNIQRGTVGECFT